MTENKQTKEYALQGTQNPMVKLIDSLKERIINVLPEGVSLEKFRKKVLAVYNSSDKLKNCTPMSVLHCCIDSEKLGLEINTPLELAFAVPYKGKAQLQLGYKGVMELCYRTGEYSQIGAYSVYENDTFNFSLGINQTLEHIPHKKPQGEPVYYYAFYKRVDGGSGFYVMSREQVIDYERQNRKGDNKSTTWINNFNEMSHVACIRKLLKYARKKADISKYEEAEEVGEIEGVDTDLMMDNI